MTTREWLIPDAVLTPAGDISEGFAIGLGTDGRISALKAAGEIRGRCRRAPGMLALPGGVNVHSHLFQSLLRGFGSDRPFLGWRDDALYRFSPRLTTEDVYTGALFALSEMLGYGITTACDFFYLQSGGNENARAVIRAAQDLGIRFVLARTMYDWDGAPKMYQESVDDAVTRTRELHTEFAGDPMVYVQPAPHSPHGASPEMIRAGVALAEELDAPMHIHLAEEPFEVEETLRDHGLTPLRYLDSLGAANGRTIAVHCCWLDDGEIARMGEAGMRLAYCPSSNMFLGDGITKLTDMVAGGVRIGLGTDGGCSNDRLCLFDEMRTASLLQKVRHHDGGALGARPAFDMGTAQGAELLGIDAGALAPGHFADIVLIERDHPSLLPHADTISNLVYGLDHRAIAEVIVAGETVAKDGHSTRVPRSEIVSRVRALTDPWLSEATPPSAR